MPDPLARRDALEEITRIVEGLRVGGEHVLVLSDYEVANLKELFRAMGYGAVVDRNPLMAAHNGDWVGQIANRLPHVEQRPNASWQELAKQASEWR